MVAFLVQGLCVAQDQPLIDAIAVDAPAMTADRPSPRSRSNASAGLWVHALVALAVALTGILLAFGIVGWQLISSTEHALSDRDAKRNTAVISGLINSRVAELRQQMISAGASTIAADGVNGLRAEDRVLVGARLRALMPHAARVDVIPRGAAEVDLNADVPITFAALDIIKRAETAEFVGPEASVSQRKIFYAASPITRDGIVVGVLFAALRDDFLLGPLSVALGTDRGSAELIQQFEGTAATTVLQWGGGVARPDPVTARLTVPHWSLSYHPAPTAVPVAGGWSTLLMPLGLAVGLTLGGVALGFSRLAKGLTTDAKTLTDYAGRLLRRRSAPLQRYRNRLFADIASDLRASAERQADQPTDSNSANTHDNGSARLAGGRRGSASTAVDEVAELLAGGDPLDVSDSQGVDNFGIQVSEQAQVAERSAEPPGTPKVKLDPDIFRAYDIRGIVDENLSEDVVYWIGRSFAAEAAAAEQTRAVIGRDGRLSSPALARALAKGLTEGGLDVTDIGQVPTPLLYFATHALNTGTGIMVTGSHNPPSYNGLKMVLATETLADSRILRLHQRIENNELTQGHGNIEAVDIVPAYLDRVVGDIALAQPLKVVVDCGNGVAGNIAPELLTQIGCEVVPLYCDIDGTFPNHHPDPADPANLEDLITVVKAEQADIGIALDGDGDRIGVVTPNGAILWPDKLMMLFSQDIVSRNPGADIVYDVKCSRHLNSLIGDYGGRPIMWRTGHSHIKAKMKETGALLGGEFSGHICFGERWYGFDDALYAAARLLEIIAAEGADVDELFAQFPTTYSTPEIKLKTTDKEKFAIMAKLTQQADFGDGTITSIDGLRVDFADSWGLVRPSNTSPILTLRFEADDEVALDRVQHTFEQQLTAIHPKLSFRAGSTNER